MTRDEFPCEGDMGWCFFLATGACPLCSKSLCDECQAAHEPDCIEENAAGEEGWDEDFDEEPMLPMDQDANP